MASIEVMNVKQTNPEAPIEIQLSTSNITYRGPKGDQGPAGPAGRDGAVGYDGKSAYELAVDNGFEGTEVEWLASLKGETGATGPAGAQGPKGDQGIQGPQGETGATGPAGAQGPAGQNGTTPVKGTDYFTQQDIADIVAQVPATDIKFLVSSGSGSSTGTNSTLLSGLSAADKTYLLDAYNDQLKNTRYFVIQDTTGALFYPLTTYSMRLVFLGGVNFQNYYYLKFDDTPGSATTIQKWDKEDVVPNWGAIKAGSTAADPFNSSANTSVADAFSYINTNFATKSYVENIVRAAQTGMLKRQVVQALPQSNIDDYTIYMVPKTGSTGDVYNEFLYMDNTWELIGNTQVDLTNYALKSEIPDITGKQDILVFANDDYDASDNPAATIGDVNSLDESIGTRIDNLTVDDIKYDDEDDGEGNLSPITLGAKLSDIDTAISNIPSGSSYTAGSGISIDSNDVISANMNPLIHSMLQMTTAGNDMPGVIRLTNTSTWEEFVDSVKAGKIVYIAASTSYTFNANYKLTPALLGITTLRALNIDAYSLATMSPSVSSYPATGTQIYYSTYYYFDGDFLWSWKKPEDLGNFIKVHYRNSNNTALGYALKQITDSIDGITGLPTPSTTDGTYKLNCAVSSGSPTYSWATDSGGGITYTAGTGITISGTTISADSQLPAEPVNDGTYKLNCSISSGASTYSWETDSGSSGGSSYTAGDGISIDANNVISRDKLDFGEPIFKLFFSLSDTYWNGSQNVYQNCSSVSALATALMRDKIAQTNSSLGRSGFSASALNTAMGTSYHIYVYTCNLAASNPMSVNHYSPTSSTVISNSSGLGGPLTFMIIEDRIFCILGSLQQAQYVFSYYLCKNLQLNTYNRHNFTQSSLAAAITELDTAISNKQDAIIPTSPSNDGTYVLQCVVSSGTPTYSWVSAS